ncbi:NUDIX hydrolase [Knoellia sinensis KCTC 19936]|uniref:NUDIX hydrolase n=1 Tax=Knoellia sinensis KCTC 19936 TaxID=1385520 RepID=A0A0A0J340_9MICO|nr:NUDIX domain-containing protein [Knoellia sinensis]KGN30527.1 NUDIX hydrolase [Knoellia sinensis KCTC 19936]
MPKFVSEFPIFSVTVDLVVLTIRDGVFSVLVIRRGEKPYAGRLALPGGFTQEREDIEDAAYRELKEEAGIGKGDVHLEQLQTFGAPRRDPRSRVVSVAWLALGADLPDPVAGSDAAAAEFRPVDEVLGSASPLAFDHADILSVGVERARSKLEYTGAAANYCPPEFTVGELRSVYEAVWGVELDPANFHRKVTRAEGFLSETGENTTRGGGRPAKLFRGSPRARLNPPILRD